MMNVTKAEAKACFEAGYPDSMGGLWSNENPGSESWATIDDGFLRNEVSFANKILRAQGVNTFGAFNGVKLSTNNGIEEPLIVPPFNPFAKLKDGMPGYMWFKDMSPVIPNIDRLELDIQFQNLSAGVLYPRWMQAVTTANEFKRLAITALAADLKLYWYETPVNMSIPRSVDLNWGL